MTNIPKNWGEVTVREVIDRYFTGISPTCEERNITDIKEWGVLKTTAITWEGWNYLAHKTLPQKLWGLKNLEVKKGNVIITKAGPRHRCGVVVFVSETIPNLIVSGKMVALEPTLKKVLPEILTLALSQDLPQKFLDVRTTGMADSQLNFTNVSLLDTPLLIPPIDEQKIITRILTSLNTSIYETKQFINKYKNIKQGLMQDLFRYGIDEKGQIRNEKTHKFKDSPLGYIPKEWDLGNIGSSYLKGRIGWQGLTTKEYLDDGQYYLVTGTDFNNGKVKWDTCHFVEKLRYAQDPKIQLKNEDILVTKDGTIGKIAYVDDVPLPATLNSGVFVIRPTNKEYIPKFLYYILRSFVFNKFIENLQAGSTINHLYQKDFVKFVFPLPKKEEQEKIIKLLDEQENTIELEERALNKLQHIKSGLMQDLLTGKVRVNHLIN